MGRKKKYLWEEMPDGLVKCPDCNGRVKRTSIQSHLKSESHIHGSDILAMRKLGYEKVFTDPKEKSTYFPEDLPCAPMRWATYYYYQGGWGHGNTVRKAWHAPKMVVQMITATNLVEDLQHHVNPQSEDRARGFFRKVFGEKENFELAASLFASLDVQHANQYERTPARVWADQVCEFLDLPKFLTSTERSLETSAWQEKVRQAEREKARQAEERARAAEYEREKTRRYNERALATVPVIIHAAQQAIAELAPGSPARTSLERVLYELTFR